MAVISTASDFFARAGLTVLDHLHCCAFVRLLYPGRLISHAPCQGYCSLTVFVGGDTVVQFRPLKYRLDLQVAAAARDVYGSFAPCPRYVANLPSSGLLVYSMTRLEGISYQEFRARNLSMGSCVEHRQRLCRDFAVFLSKAWYHSSNNPPSLPRGKVGISIVSRIALLSAHLPKRFRATARNVLDRLSQIEALPWVLSHGDIVASNLIVDPLSCSLSGLVDFAEAEYLPFGVCLYGLEEILGEMTPSGFQYHQDANPLRMIFWAELSECIPDLKQSSVLDAVKFARELGILLWHGIAFDNGAIDRVVEEGKDVDEVRRPDAFLEIYDLERA